MVTLKKLVIIVTWLANLEAQLIGIVTNLRLTKKVPVIFHNLRGYDSHLIFYELKTFDVKIDVIPNGLEKYMAFILYKNIVFNDSMQFMNSSLEKLVKNLSDNDFKYLTEEFGSKNKTFETKRCLSLWVHRQF